MSGNQTDVFVVGGGPAGLAAAIAARREGFRVTLADILRPPIDKACGEGLMPDSLAELGRLGVSLEDSERGPFRGVRFVGGNRSVEAEFASGTGAGIRRTLLHAALIEHAQRRGVELLWGVRVSAVGKGAVVVGGRRVRCRWVIGADGQDSQVRKWAGLGAGREYERRIGLRQHFVLPKCPEFVEVHWGEKSQAYLTPISSKEICVALLSKRPVGSFEDELARLPSAAAYLRNAHPSTQVRGAVTVSNCLRAVYREGIVLIGEASGSVDAITGGGLGLAFRQALALGRALAADDLSLYQTAHREIARVPQFMRRTLLLMDKSSLLRQRALHALQAKPGLFARMLSVHVGALPLSQFGASAMLELGWQLLAA